MENRRARQRSQQHPRDGLDDFQRRRADRPFDRSRVNAAYTRLDDAEQLLYERWHREHAENEARDDPVRLLLSHDIMLENSDGKLWLLGLGEKVAALGGHLEVVAVFDDESTTLIREPGPDEQPPILERTDGLADGRMDNAPAELELHDPTEKIAVDLTPEERDFILAALDEWLGPTAPTEELAIAMGFNGFNHFVDELRRLLAALDDEEPLISLDWRRVLIATEIVYASEYFGAGSDWEDSTCRDDHVSLQLLRGIQNKLIDIATRRVRPEDDSGELPSS